ncbi:hypothetical protein [Nitrolancea hollandica]|nr:hypothetical protein [Nitrolancea hollandica]
MPYSLSINSETVTFIAADTRLGMYPPFDRKRDRDPTYHRRFTPG